MIPRFKADLGPTDWAALWPSGDSQGDVERFEAGFADLAGQRHAIAFPYGRTALIALLRALGRSGSEVICPSYTCVVVPHAIVKAGLQPVFVDSDPHDYNMDWSFVEAATGPKTAAVVATSIFGHPVNGKPFENYRQANPNPTIFQDCAHSFFAGDAHLDGLAAFYGLNVSKLITSIFGGMVTTDDAGFANRVRAVRGEILKVGGISQGLRRACYLAAVIPAFWRPIYAAVNRLERSGALDRFVKYYDPAVIDLPHDAFVAMGGLEARIGRQQLSRYSAIVAHRRAIAEIYHNELTDVGDLTMPPRHPGMTVSHFVVRTGRSQAVNAACLKVGFQLGELIEYDCSRMPTYRQAKYFGDSRSRQYPGNLLNLPVHRGVGPHDARRLCAHIRKLFGE